MFAATVLASLPAAAKGQDLRLWPAISVSAPVNDDLVVRADALVETTSAGSTTGLSVVRVVLLRQVDDKLSYGGGYTWVHGVTGAGAEYVEHRGVQELDLRLIGSARGVRITTKTRLEERLRASESGISVRLRHQTRLDVPISASAISLVAWNEYFHRFNGTAWSGSAGPAIINDFIGVRIPLTKAVAVEPGYINQVSFGAAGTRVGHIAALTTVVRL